MYNTEQDVREALEKKKGRNVKDTVWKHLVSKSYVEEVLSGEYADSFSQLVREEAELHNLAGNSQAKESKEQYIPTRFMVSRSRAVASLLAREARSRPDVREFRQEALGGLLLTAEEVPVWVEEQHKRDGSAKAIDVSLNFDIDIDKAQQFEGLVRAAIGKGEQLDVGKIGPGILLTSSVRSKACILSYGKPDDEWSHNLPVNPAGVLGRLQAIADKLSKDYNWGDENAVQFILTDSTPRIGADVEWSNRRIRLSIPRWYSDAEVANAYRLARKNPLLFESAKLPRSLSDRTAKLVMFVSSRPEDSWNQLWDAWNRRQDIPKEWHFKTAQAMNSVFCRAEKRLLENA